MSDFEVRIGDEVVTVGDWRLEWDDRDHGLARLVGDGRAIPVIVEGSGSEWFVTLRGRRVPVSARTWRERLMAEAERAATVHTGPVAVKATLPGLVVAVVVAVGDDVEEGAPLVTIEAMKMQNEIRAPRNGRVVAIEVVLGQAITGGALLVRLADPEP